MGTRLARELCVICLGALCLLAAGLVGCGGSAAAPAIGFLYVTNAGANTVSAFAVNANTGALSPVPGSPFAAGMQPMSVTADASGKFLFAGNNGGASGAGTVSAYTIDAATGALAEVGPPIAAADPVIGLAADPSGPFLYAATHNAAPCCSSAISGYLIDGTSGALTPMTGSPFTSIAFAQQLVVEPAGKFLYVADNGWVVAHGMSIDAATGALAEVPGSPFAAGSDPLGVAVHPSGKFLYVTDAESTNVGNVLAYRIDSTSGALAAIAGSPFSSGTNPMAAAVDPAGKFLYVAGAGGLGGRPEVDAFAIDATSGVLTPIGTPLLGVNPTSIAVDPSGKFVYVTNAFANSVSVYSVGANGGLTEVAGSPFPVPGAPFGVTAIRKQ